MTLFKVIFLPVLFIFSLQVNAANEAPPSLTPSDASSTNNDATILPTIPELEDDSRNIPEPDVRIIRKKDTVIEEYRVQGRLRFVKITPNVGKPYYLVDTDGDGILETRENDLDNPPINRWILLEW